MGTLAQQCIATFALRVHAREVATACHGRLYPIRGVTPMSDYRSYPWYLLAQAYGGTASLLMSQPVPGDPVGPADVGHHRRQRVDAR
jgi:hypothetical protein